MKASIFMMFMLMVTIVQVFAPMFPTSTPPFFLNFFCVPSFLTIVIRLKMTRNSDFSDKVTSDKGNLFHLSDFSRQSLAFSVEFVSLD